MIDTKERIGSLFNENEVEIYRKFTREMQEKYRLYITRRIYVNTFESSDTMPPSQWIEQYQEKKKFIEIAEKLNMTEKEVMEIYNSAIAKMRKYCESKGIRIENYENYLPE